MADASLLALLAGTDPQAAQMLAGAQGLQLSQAATDPAFGHNEGLFGALAKTIAGARGSGMVNDAVQANMAARQAAAPELAKLYGSGDPYKEIGDNPQGYSPVALASILAGANPETIAKMRALNTQTAIQGLNLSGYQGLRQGAANGQQPAITPVPGKGGGAIASAAQPTSISALTTGRQPVSAPAAEAPSNFDVGSLASMPPPQQAQAIAKMTPAQRIALSRQMAQSRARLTPQASGGQNALRPPT